jgi:ureidoacrylate peracid hydrolase
MTTEPLRTLDQVLAPERCALLVIDIQNDFIHPQGWGARHDPGAPSLRHVIPVINAVIARARGAGVRIAYVCMEHGPALDAANYRARYAARAMVGDILCEAGGWGARLDDALTAPSAEDLVVIRHTYDGFAGTGLDASLRAQGIETVVGCGVVTNLCVQTTVHHAFALGYYVAVVSDGTAAASPAEHDLTLQNFARYFGAVIPSAELLERWTPAATARRLA